MASHHPHHRLSTGSNSSLSSPPPSSPSDSELSDLSATPSPPSSPTFVRRPLLISPPPTKASSRRSSAKTTPAPDDMGPTPPTSDNDGPARKRRKVVLPKQPTQPKQPGERTTERLDLNQDHLDDDPQLKRILDVLHKKRKIVVIAGAGISVSAGIPDFRSSNGLFSTLKSDQKLKSSGKDLFDASVYKDNDSTSSFHDMVRSLSKKTKDAQPTPFHHLLARLAHEDRLLRLYTQNVDGIDTSLPPLRTEVPFPVKGPYPKTVQLHGGLDHMVCSKGHAGDDGVFDFNADIFNGPVPPACPRCTENDEVRQAAEKRTHGIGRLRPRMVLYNEHHPDSEAIGACTALDLRTRPDAVIVAGTTLKVPGVRRIVREMCAVVRDRKDGVTIWINNDPEPLGKDLANSWDIIVQGPCDEIARHAAMSKWDDPTPLEVSDDEFNHIKGKQKPVVLVSTPQKQGAFEQPQMLTPAASPYSQRALILDPSTPSKTNPRKRKSDAQPSAVVSKTKAPAKSQKKPPAQKKAPAKRKAKAVVPENRKMTNHFTASKSSASARLSIAPKKDTSFIAPNNDDQGLPETANMMDFQPVPSTPRGSVVTRWRAMANLSTHHSRFNHSPEMEPFSSPSKPSPPNSPSHTTFLPQTTTAGFESVQDARPSTSSSWKNETIVPAGRLPRDLDSLIDT